MQRYQWDWGVLFRDPYFGWLLSGLGWTLFIAMLAWMIAFSVGSTIGICRTLPNRWLRLIGTAYVEVFRNVPLLLQMFLWFFVLPELLPREAGRWMKRDMPYPEFTSAVLCLGFYHASRIAEQVRSGIDSVAKGLAHAGLATGLTLQQTYRHILMPIAYRLIVPTLSSEFLGIIKNSSIALTIGVLELTNQSRQIESFTFRGFEAFTAATVIYIAVSMVALGLARMFERRSPIKGMMTREASS
jgi:glutamate/aspartate transport system permease protein